MSAALLPAGSAQADLIISTTSVIANAGSTGNTLEIDLQNTGSSAVTDIASFSWQIMTSASNIVFPGATTGDSPPPTPNSTYIFSGDSFADSNFGSDITGANTGQSLSASDLTNSGGVSFGAGDTVSLGIAFFDVPSGPSGVFPVTFDTSVAALSDSSGNAIPITTFDGGTITVNASAVPEPSTLVLALLSCPAGLWMAWRQRTAAARAARNGASDSSTLA